MKKNDISWLPLGKSISELRYKANRKSQSQTMDAKELKRVFETNISKQ